ncbi:MAG: 4Fe-4S binding protein [Bacteroidales bacterium]|nr:4Fe-4S binding protein [Bacteroidales bacterium]
MSINKLFKNRYFLPVIQFFTLTIFILLIYGAIGITTQDPDFAKILRNTNFSNLIVWSYWWSLIIVTAILFGRFWCSICPMELITSFAGKIGLKQKPDKFLKSGWVITIFYAIILIIGIHTFAIHRIPQYMAIYMLILFAIALVSGLIWEKRTFCTYICPIGHLLGLYSMLSFKKLRVLDSNVCKDCKTKDCISKTNYYKFTGRSCTSELYPTKITDNRTCILCGQCHKSCSKDNITIQNRKFAFDLFTNIKLSRAEIAYFIIVSGFVVYEILSEWKVSKDFVMIIPDWINYSIDIASSLSGTINAIVLFVLLPIIFYMILSILKKVIAKETWIKSFTQLVIVILPVTASMHLLKALLKTTSRIPYWDFVFSDPKGVKTAQLLINNPELLNKDILSVISPYIGIIAILLSVGGLALSLFIIRKQQYKNRTSRIISIFAVLIYSSIFLITLTAWRMF